ncbi:hypothetical protein CKAH01_17490 [Colletotrichum kahawae]|uniref:Uncharacterized protein n=1 Tax=Colletotrichum kahawae TaxID=34407 RepID=A0AAE0D4U7_COLKA|nr:hypothetical protein CKAH01_17490 [Colletotrichum kahawae]
MSQELVLRSNAVDSDQGSISLENKGKENELDWIVRKPGFGLPLGHMPDDGNRFPCCTWTTGGAEDGAPPRCSSASAA